MLTYITRTLGVISECSSKVVMDLTPPPTNNESFDAGRAVIGRIIQYPDQKRQKKFSNSTI